jgi:hypothetical protein
MSYVSFEFEALNLTLSAEWYTFQIHSDELVRNTGMMSCIIHELLEEKNAAEARYIP